MDTNGNSVIDDIYYAFLKKRNELNRLVKKNQEEIQETEALLKSLMETDADMKYFSPRNTEDIYKNEISSAKDKIEHLIQENEMSISQMEELSKKIEELKIFKDQEAHQIELSNALLDVQEMDRQRIARELHDTTVQNLAHLIHEIELSSLYIDKDPIQAKLELESCSKNLRGIIDEMRMVIFNLRPMSFNDLGFDRCLDDYIQNMKESNADILFVTDIDEVSTKISEYRLLILFRMIQEAVQNSIIHSKSDRIELSVKNKGNQLLVKIRDYGIGFEDGNKKENHFGLSMMQERAKIIHAVFQVHSVLNEGTEITIQVASDE